MRYIRIVLVLGLMAPVALSASPAPLPGSESRVLNNFVTELLSVPRVEQEHAEFAFSTPRTGWIFVSVEKSGSPVPGAYLDACAEALVWRPNPCTGTYEAMRYVTEGNHRLRLENAGGSRVDVRAIPELAYCYYPTLPHIPAYGSYDWSYVGRYVLPHVNVLVNRSETPKEQIEAWLKEGRHWFGNASLPGLGQTDPPTAESVYEAWAANPAVTQPQFSGLMVDEFFGGSPGHYRAWIEAIKRLNANEGFKNKVYYAWCGDLYLGDSGTLLSRALMEMNYRFSWEKYLDEKSTKKKAARQIEGKLVKPMEAWRKAMPGVERNMVMCLGYLCAPPESLNVDPGVDYHVFLDMQFHALANDRAFQGLYGVMEYMADYADEESLRYAHELFRHYCIDGKRERYNGDPYVLPHLRNPDFSDGLDEWRVEPAEKGSIEARSMGGFSWLQGRYPKTKAGDRFCWMKRSAQKPNRVVQSLKALDGDRLYSVKFITADLEQLDQNKATSISIDVTGAEILNEYDLRFTYPSCYSHEVKPYTKDHPAYMTLHRIVFQAGAKPEDTELAISDWANSSEPGGPVGQETALNFVEVQPFHAPK